LTSPQIELTSYLSEDRACTHQLLGVHRECKIEVEDLANFIADKLDIHLPPSDDEADS
jgi:hypothetical protein